jgi:serine/threonine-protein kinase
MDQLVADLEKLDHGVLPDAVQEMMARSGGFNVPADYFRATAMPAPMPASPLVPIKRWPLYAAIGAVATVLGVVAIGIVAKSSSSTAETRMPPPPVATVALPALPTVTATAPSAPAAVTLAPVATTREVLVSVAPADATVTRDGKDLGPLPVALHLGDGERASLLVTRKGYKSKTVTVDGSQPRQMFSLDSLYPGPAANAGTKPAPAQGSRFGGIDDVGDPFAKH